MSELKEMVIHEPTARERVVLNLYEARKRAIDPECSYTIREESWVAIDGLLDQLNSLKP